MGMTGILVRVGADLSVGGGSWNGPVDSDTGQFAYVAIPESFPVFEGMERPYSALAPIIAKFGVVLPAQLRARHMHLDPDFQHLTYGDQGERAKQLRDNLSDGDLVIFYAALADARAASLVYAFIGLFVVERLGLASEVPPELRDINAHSRRVLRAGSTDIIVYGRPAVSGRLMRCLPIGEYRDRAYRVKRDLLEAWGSLSVKDGYLQRSARLPRLLDPLRFMRWLERQEPTLIQSNN